MKRLFIVLALFQIWSAASAQPTPPLQYAGHSIDEETGLVYANSRYIDRSVGIFTSADLHFIEKPNQCIEKHRECNLYSYTANSPVTYVDPDGRFLRKALRNAWQYIGRQMSRAYQNSRWAYARLTGVPRVRVDSAQYPQSAQHIRDAQANGYPSVLTLDRSGSRQNRRESLRNIQTQPGMDRDEYPPASAREGGRGASVRHIPSSDNQGAGSSMGHQYNGRGERRGLGKINDGESYILEAS